ncbi:uncharacterized protein LOC129601901 [Paramacrobiotus metropolitanus]|uniref:uncharacterized protein LOC129601901 n=1 Tax=Paramacrobiotus metropolitanus TaxID=2943436 RepID=UPI0024460B56|nr:uncharacterized protein LOC129601901 [Paramacrobiotus metropolitanus]
MTVQLTLPESDYAMLDANDRITTLQLDTDRRLQLLEQQLKAVMSAAGASPKRKSDEVIPAGEQPDTGVSPPCSKTYSQSELDNAVRAAVEKAMEVARENNAAPVLTQTYVRGGGPRGRFNGYSGRGRGRGGRGRLPHHGPGGPMPTASRDIPAETTEEVEHPDGCRGSGA